MGEWWNEEPWRMVQTNLREIDLRDMDAERFARDVTELHATVVMVSTSGIVANYPTRLPYQFRNPYASDTVLADVIAACHRRGIRVIGRMDFSKVRRAIADAHPEWAFVSEKGERVCYNGDTHVCCNSEYQRELSLNILRETLETLPLDGVFFNFGGYTSGYDYSGNLYGDCVCENCQRRFRELYGAELPAHPADSPLYAEFKRVTQARAQQDVLDVVKAVRPGACVANDLFSGVGFFRSESGSSLHGGDWRYLASDLVSRARTGYPRLRVSVATVDFIDIAYRYASPSMDRQRARIAQSLAHGGSPDLYLMGRIDNREDRTGVRAAREMFAFHERHQEVYASLRSEARLLIVRPETPWFTGGDAGREYAGWYEMLAQEHFLFDAADASRLPELPLDRYQAVVLPAVCLSPEASAAVERYARAGGRVLATWGGEAVPEWLGAEGDPDVTRDTRGAYIRLDEGDASPALKALGVSVLPVVEGYAHCAYRPDVERRQRLVPPHPYGPPERCYYTVLSDEPGYTVRALEGGCAAWIPWRPGLGFKAGRQVSMALWMRDALEQTLGVAPLQTDAPACVELTLHRCAAGGLLLQLVNGSGETGGVWRAPLPLGPIHVTIPCERPRTVHGLENDACRWSWQDGRLTVEAMIPQVLTAIRIEA